MQWKKTVAMIDDYIDTCTAHFGRAMFLVLFIAVLLLWIIVAASFYTFGAWLIGAISIHNTKLIWFFVVAWSLTPAVAFVAWRLGEQASWHLFTRQW